MFVHLQLNNWSYCKVLESCGTFHFPCHCLGQETMADFWLSFLQGLCGVVVKLCRDCVPENILVKMLETVLKLVNTLTVLV